MFDELIARGEEIKKTCKGLYFSGSKKKISAEAFEAWKINSLSLLKSTFGASSPHYDNFTRLKFFDHYNSTQIYLGILKGAREDLRCGYFFHKDLMLSVNIYHSLISRARQIAGKGDAIKAAAVLETALLEVLAKICENKRVSYQQEDRIEDLASRLVTVGAIGEMIHRTIVEKQLLLNGSTAPESRLGALSDFAAWLQEFLNDYLGSQIMILN
jgi:hypothetical protein